MTNVYLQYRHYHVVVNEDSNSVDFGTWRPNTEIKQWLDTNCKDNWCVELTNSFSWELYHSWMNDSLNKALEMQSNSSGYKFRYNKSDIMNFYDVYIVCLPYIKFASIDDALLCRLTF